MNSFPARAAVIPVKTRQSILINVCKKRNFFLHKYIWPVFFFLSACRSVVLNNPKYGADMTHVFNSQAPFSLSNVSMPRRDRIYLAPYYFAQQKPQKSKGLSNKIKAFCLLLKKSFRAHNNPRVNTTEKTRRIATSNVSVWLNWTCMKRDFFGLFVSCFLGKKLLLLGCITVDRRPPGIKSKRLVEWRNHEENLFGFFRCSQETNGRKRRERKNRGGYIFVILPWVSAFDTAANKAKATPTTTSVGQPAMKENLLERIFGLDVKKMWAKPTPRRHSGKTSFSGEFLFVCLFSLSPTFFSFYFPTAAASERVTRWGRGERTCTSRFSLISSSTLFSLLLLLPRGAKYPVTK